MPKTEKNGHEDIMRENIAWKELAELIGASGESTKLVQLDNFANLSIRLVQSQAYNKHVNHFSTLAN